MQSGTKLQRGGQYSGLRRLAELKAVLEHIKVLEARDAIDGTCPRREGLRSLG